MANVHVEVITTLAAGDLHDLCDATEAAILDGGGFGWITPPGRETLEQYWQGVLIIPNRILLVGRLDSVIAGSIQLRWWPPSQEAQAFSGLLTTFFIAPWARGHGLGHKLVEFAETEARSRSLQVLHLDIRETQSRAIRLYERLGYQRWGVNPRYAFVNGQIIQGIYFVKDIDPALTQIAETESQEG